METELALQNMRRLSNVESNRLTKRCIQSATVKLMGEKDFSEISITEIINRSGVSRASFYRNYHTKEDVISEFCGDVCEKITGYLKEPPSSYSEWYARVFREVREDQDTFRLMLEANMDLTGLFPDGIPEIRTRLERYALRARRSAFCAILVEWFQSGMKESPKEMGNFCAELLRPEKRKGA